MKGLKKLALVSAIAAVSAGAQAELKALDDSAMGELTGQGGGLTIDVETKFTIGEFAYEDAGFVVLQDISLGQNTNIGVVGSEAENQIGNADGLLDNFRITLDIAGDGSTTDADGTADNVFNDRMSEVEGLAKVMVANGNSDTGILAAAGGTDISTGAAQTINAKKTYNDGDLVIHFGFTDAWQQGGGFGAYLAGAGKASRSDATATGLNDMTYAGALDVGLHAVDFNFSIDVLGLAESGYTVGSKGVQKTDHSTGMDSDATTTALISDISFNGFLGPEDLIIQNNGNGFGAVDSDSDGNISQAESDAGSGIGAANSKIVWGSYFNITDLDLYIDIAGVQLSDITINNTRGDTTDLFGDASFGFAHSIRTIYAVKDAVLNLNKLTVPASPYVDGVAINTQFKGDMKIGELSFGDTGDSIGTIWLTDIESTTNWTISAH